MLPASLYYDKNDYKLLEMVDDVLSRGVDRSQFKNLLQPYLKPHGIKEMAAPRGLRIAYAIMRLLQSLKSDQASDRIQSLSALRDETLTAAKGAMRNNRARVLIQICKELIRAEGNPRKQLDLARDFRCTAHGKTRFVRQQLRKYHLLEMPEAWNQIAFDDRVHDANSKGRKSATHLVMDAWVKGIRELTVVYYDFLDPAVARELFASAAILGIRAKVGIEYRARFHNRFVKIVWSPNGLQDVSDVDGFYRQERVLRLMDQGREVQAERTRYVRAVTAQFNNHHRESIGQEFGIFLPAVDVEDVIRSVGTAQLSVHHLGSYIHRLAMPLFEEQVELLREKYEHADYDAKAAIGVQIEALDSLDADTIVARYLSPGQNPEIPDNVHPAPGTGPELLNMTPAELTAMLARASHGCQMTLILAGLEVGDTLELLYDCKGRISHLEVFNIKNYTGLQLSQRKSVSLLQRALNEQNAVLLKRMVRQCLEQVREADRPDREQQEAKLETILSEFHVLLDYYRRTRLKTRIGSGSTGGSSRTHGMGFALADTLPLRAQRESRNDEGAVCIPVSGRVTECLMFSPRRDRPGRLGSLTHGVCHIPVLRNWFCRTSQVWREQEYSVVEEGCGNVVPLGGISPSGNGFKLFDETSSHRRRPPLSRLDSRLQNLLKVFVGFVPAFLTFYLTKDWWVLAYLGGFIWFAITGLRNVIQSVLGGGGLHRSSYLPWSEFVDWDRISDSLLYTGFSVPLLDWLCKSVLLNHGLGITVSSDPITLYAVMALVNGVYISWHNVIRGLPHSAAVANFFRSILSIPVAIFFSWVLGRVMIMSGHPDVAGALQLWAAIISKLASDFVAAVIEGIADRDRNIDMRHWDYSEKLKQVFELFSQLEIEFPTIDMLGTLEHPKEFLRLTSDTGTDHARELIANALDLLYIRVCKPRAREALRQAVVNMSEEERSVFMVSQQILTREREVSRLFVDGLVGRNFSKALSFYLLRYGGYLKELKSLSASAATATRRG